MTGAQLAAGLSGVCTVLAAWEAIGLAQGARLAGRLATILAPLRNGGTTGGRDVPAVERRRLIALLATTLLLAGWLVAGPIAAAAACTAGPWLVGRALALRRARWRRAMAEGAPVAARAIADALAGGHSVRGALAEAAAAGGAGGAVDTALQRARASLVLGARTQTVLAELRSAAAGPAWDTLVAAILLQREAGGDLAALLRELAGELEQARRVEADARAATAQARFTAGTVAALPILAAALAELAAPGTMASMTGSPVSLVLVAGAVVLQVTGMLLVRRLAVGMEA
jgi:tight adherence protein B